MRRGVQGNASAMNWMMRWMLCRYAAQLGDALFRSLDPKVRDKAARTRDALGEEPMVETFTFLAWDEGGMMIGSTGAHRLVCVADSGARVVIFGHESELRNINTVLEAGLPCIVRCETRRASRTANRFAGHTHWVWEHCMLEVVPSRVDEEILEPRDRGTSLKSSVCRGCGFRPEVIAHSSAR